MKFFHKKEVTLEKTPILFRLERRHTLLDGAKDEDSVDESKRVYRANSVGSYTSPSTPRDTKPDGTPTKQCLANGNSRVSSAASTVIITESELSSSWLYNTRKAKRVSDEETISTNSNVSSDVPDIQPVQLHDPNLKPVPVPLKKRPEKASSCCCYLLVALTICLASLGIMAAIGGIIYLEIFAVYREVTEGKHANREPSLAGAITHESKSDQSTLHPNEGWSLNGFRNLVANSPFVQDFITSIKDNIMLNRREDLPQKTPIDELGGKVLVSSNVANLSEDSKKAPDHGNQLNRNVINNGDSLHKDNDVIEDIMLDGGSNKEDNDKKVNSSDLIDLNSKETVDMEMTDPISNILVPQDNNGNEGNYELENKQGEINTNSSDNSNFEDLDSILNHETPSRFPRMEQDALVNNSQEIKNFEENISDDENPDITVNEDQEYENGFEIEPQNRNLFDDSSLDYELVMNRPIVEAKPPIDFQRHLISKQNKDFDQPLTIEDMDRKFSLSEILKHLRTIEVNNQLPSTRQSQKSVTETMTSSMVVNQDFGVERNEYLKNLRQKIYI